MGEIEACAVQGCGRVAGFRCKDEVHPICFRCIPALGERCPVCRQQEEKQLTFGADFRRKE